MHAVRLVATLCVLWWTAHAQTNPPTEGLENDWSPSPAEERSLLQLAQQKCVEYRKHVFELDPTPLPIAGSEYRNRSTCAMGTEPLIAGNVPSAPREFPHMAVIGYGDGNTGWKCGGSLISNRHILTAAHCASSPSAGYAQRVLLGALSLNDTNDNSEAQEFKIVRRIRHPRYRPPKRYNDIAIFELDHDVLFTGYVRPACLYDTYGTPDDKRGIETGFGILNWFNGDGSNMLKKVTLMLQPFTKCNETFRSNLRLPDGLDDNSMLCAGDLREGKDICQGDGGGPLQVQDIDNCMYKIIGVSSFGTPCVITYGTTVYTRVSKYVPWIAKIVWA